jgi:hypothetical protein
LTTAANLINVDRIIDETILKEVTIQTQGTLRQGKNCEETLRASEVGIYLIAYIMQRRNMIRNKMKYSGLYYFLFVTAATNSVILLSIVQKIVSPAQNQRQLKSCGRGG